MIIPKKSDETLIYSSTFYSTKADVTDYSGVFLMIFKLLFMVIDILDLSIYFNTSASFDFRFMRKILFNLEY